MLKYVATAWFTVFVLTMLFYTGVLPLAVAADLSAYRPVAVVYDDDLFDRVVMVVDGCGPVTTAVFWFHWSYDGFERRDDWEPVVVAVHSGSVHVYARAHYVWREVRTVFNGSRPIIVFSYLWHTPTAFTGFEPGTRFVDYEPVVSYEHPAEIDVCRAVDVWSNLPNWLVSSAGIASLVSGIVGVLMLAARYVRRSV